MFSIDVGYITLTKLTSSGWIVIYPNFFDNLIVGYKGGKRKKKILYCVLEHLTMWPKKEKKINKL